jgi:hypothetical protein
MGKHAYRCTGCGRSFKHKTGRTDGTVKCSSCGGLAERRGATTAKEPAPPEPQQPDPSLRAGPASVISSGGKVEFYGTNFWGGNIAIRPYQSEVNLYDVGMYGVKRPIVGDENDIDIDNLDWEP